MPGSYCLRLESHLSRGDLLSVTTVASFDLSFQTDPQNDLEDSYKYLYVVLCCLFVSLLLYWHTYASPSLPLIPGDPAPLVHCRSSARTIIGSTVSSCTRGAHLSLLSLGYRSA